MISLLCLLSSRKGQWKKITQNCDMYNKAQLMFSKLRLGSRVQEKQNKYSYTQRSISQKKMKSSYASIHKINKKQPQPSQHQVGWTPTFHYQGNIDRHKKNDQGIMIMNDGSAIVGNWHRDLLNGKVLIFTPFGGKIVAHYINGKLNGWSISLFENRIIILTHYFQDKIDGERIIFEEAEKLWVASKYTEHGKFIQITHIENGSRNKLPSFLDDEEIQYFFEQVILHNQYLPHLKHIQSKPITSAMDYVGYCNQEGNPEGLGVLHSLNQFYIGNFKNGCLQDFGRILFSNGQIYHGRLEEGNFAGDGFLFNPIKNTSIIINTGETQKVLEKNEGYILVDFNIRIGGKLKNENIGFQLGGFQEQAQLLVKYYHCYYIDEDEYNLSNVGNYPSNKRESQFDQQSPKSRKKTQKWLSIDFDGYSQKYEQEEEISQQKSANPYSPRNFESLQICENIFPSESEKYNKSTPKQINKKQMFTDSNFASSPSKLQQLTFRHRQERNETQRSTYRLTSTQRKNRKKIFE